MSKRQRVEWVERNKNPRDLGDGSLKSSFPCQEAYFPTANPIFQLARQREIVNLDECPMEF
jgi:hypothetical protein